MGGRLILLTFAVRARNHPAAPDFVSLAKAFCRSALASGFDEAYITTDQDMAGTDFYRQNKYILEQPKGVGNWLWKPYVIKKLLEKASAQDVILYCDAGRTGYYQFTRRPILLEERVRNSEAGYLIGVTVPQFGPLRCWTKRDCLLLMEADTPELVGKPVIQATWNLWRPTSQAFEFLERWLSYGSDPRCITSDPNTLGFPNYTDFREHRFDQSILTILGHKGQAPYLDFSGTRVQKLICKYPETLLSHQFFKRPQNADALLATDSPLILAREWLRLRSTDH